MILTSSPIWYAKYHVLFSSGCGIIEHEPGSEMDYTAPGGVFYI